MKQRAGTPPPSAPQPGPSDGLAAAALAARLIVGVVLLFSGLHKAAAPPEEFAAVIDGYYIVSESAAATLARAIPWAEVLVGTFLAAGWMTRACSAAACGMFAAFIGALASTKYRGIPLKSCGCFGDGVHLSPWQAMGLDSCLTALSVLALRRGRARLSLDNWVEAQ